MSTSLPARPSGVMPWLASEHVLHCVPSTPLEARPAKVAGTWPRHGDMSFSCSSCSSPAHDNPPVPGGDGQATNERGGWCGVQRASYLSLCSLCRACGQQTIADGMDEARQRRDSFHCDPPRDGRSTDKDCKQSSCRERGAGRHSQTGPRRGSCRKGTEWQQRGRAGMGEKAGKRNEGWWLRGCVVQIAPLFRSEGEANPAWKERADGQCDEPAARPFEPQLCETRQAGAPPGKRQLPACTRPAPAAAPLPATFTCACAFVHNHASVQAQAGTRRRYTVRSTSSECTPAMHGSYGPKKRTQAVTHGRFSISMPPCPTTSYRLQSSATTTGRPPAGG